MTEQTALAPTVLTQTVTAADDWNIPAIMLLAALADYNRGGASETLLLKGWNFSIPSGATIGGVALTLTGGTAGGLSLTITGPQLLKAGAAAGTAKTGASISMSGLSEGSSSDMWGTTLTPADVNDAGFGFQFAISQPPDDPNTTVVMAATMTVTYTLPPTNETDVTSTISAILSALKDVLTAISGIRDNSSDVTSTISAGVGVNVTSPASMSTVTSAAFTVEWTQNPGVQTDYRVLIYSDAAGTVLVYDSGVIGSSLTSHSIPAGLIPSPATLYLRVKVTNSELATGQSVLVQFATNFAAGADVTGVTATVEGCGRDARGLPVVVVRWAQAVPAGGEAFAQYDIRRREVGESTFVRIATVAAISTLTYRDTTAAPNVAYEYAVVYEAASGASTLISANQSPAPWAMLSFDHNYLHDPATETFLRVDAWDASVDVQDDVTFNQPWGQATPNAYHGERDSHRITMRLHPLMLADPRAWATLDELRRLQREAGAVLCLRLGRAEARYFVTLSHPTKQHSQMQFTAALELQETFVDEAV